MTGWGVERQGGVAGLAGIVLGAAAEVFERGVSRGGGAAATAAHYADQAAGLRAQALLFALGGALTLWFLAGLRARLRRTVRAEQPFGDLALVAGAASTVLTLAALAVQEALTLEPAPAALAALADTLFLLAGVPLAVLLVAVAVPSLARHALPVWVCWLSLAAAVTQLLPLLGMLAGSGPVAPGGWLSAFLPYPLYLVWLGAVAVLLTIAHGAGGEAEAARRPAGAGALR
ncbi:MAG: hypothetical protein ACTHJL_05375 [Amnibacterium sp.]